MHVFTGLCNKQPMNCQTKHFKIFSVKLSWCFDEIQILNAQDNYSSNKPFRFLSLTMIFFLKNVHDLLLYRCPTPGCDGTGNVNCNRPTTEPKTYFVYHLLNWYLTCIMCIQSRWKKNSGIFIDRAPVLIWDLCAHYMTIIFQYNRLMTV